MASRADAPSSSATLAPWLAGFTILVFGALVGTRPSAVVGGWDWAVWLGVSATGVSALLARSWYAATLAIAAFALALQAPWPLAGLAGMAFLYALHAPARRQLVSSLRKPHPRLRGVRWLATTSAVSFVLAFGAVGVLQMWLRDGPAYVLTLPAQGPLHLAGLPGGRPGVIGAVAMGLVLSWLRRGFGLSACFLAHFVVDVALFFMLAWPAPL